MVWHVCMRVLSCLCVILCDVMCMCVCGMCVSSENMCYIHRKMQVSNFQDYKPGSLHTLPTGVYSSLSTAAREGLFHISFPETDMEEK